MFRCGLRDDSREARRERSLTGASTSTATDGSSNSSSRRVRSDRTEEKDMSKRTAGSKYSVGNSSSMATALLSLGIPTNESTSSDHPVSQWFMGTPAVIKPTRHGGSVRGEGHGAAAEYAPRSELAAGKAVESTRCRSTSRRQRPSSRSGGTARYHEDDGNTRRKGTALQRCRGEGGIAGCLQLQRRRERILTMTLSRRVRGTIERFEAGQPEELETSVRNV